jgi:hypothetical protein
MTAGTPLLSSGLTNSQAPLLQALNTPSRVPAAASAGANSRAYRGMLPPLAEPSRTR